MISLRVMVVDEEASSRALIESSLAHDPFFVLRGCGSGVEALATAVEWRPDLTLLDDMMPDMDATTVLARMRSDERTAPIPVVFVSGRAPQRELLKELGVSGVIAKPLDPIELPAAMRRFVPVEGSLAPLRENFLKRLDADAGALSACRALLPRPSAMRRVNRVAHALAGAGGTYGFAGITCDAAALAAAAERHLAGCGGQIDVEQTLDRLLLRIAPNRE
jgi:CheY-like chemotaxis protein